MVHRESLSAVAQKLLTMGCSGIWGKLGALSCKSVASFDQVSVGCCSLKTLEDEVGTVGEERAHHGYWVKGALTSG